MIRVNVQELERLMEERRWGWGALQDNLHVTPTTVRNIQIGSGVGRKVIQAMKREFGFAALEGLLIFDDAEECEEEAEVEAA